ncbi:conserved hypothetical protein [Gammaproteobacteria bacterium]
MILELFEYLLTPCSRTARTMGFLASATQVRARYRRCKRAWAPHISQTRRIILDTVGCCQRRRKIVILGAGLLHDIPLRELSQLFHRVLLVDIVHPFLSRLAVHQFRNVEMISADITEIMEQLQQTTLTPGGLLPISHPMKFVDDPEIDLTISVNLLSQLPQIPARYLEGRCDEVTVNAFLKHLIEAHLNYLLRLPGHTTLITDLTIRHTTTDGKLLEEKNALYEVRLPVADSTWEWSLAVSPEIVRGIDISTTVGVYRDWKKSQRLATHLSRNST